MKNKKDSPEWVSSDGNYSYDKDFHLTADYWDGCVRDGTHFHMIRSGWGKKDFEDRVDETMALGFDYKDTDTVLDLGCGVGYACKVVAPYVKKYVGLDFSAQSIAEAKELNKSFTNADFAVGDGMKIPFEDNFFDIIFCELVFQHTSRPMTLSYFDEIKRTIKSGTMEIGNDGTMQATENGSYILQVTTSNSSTCVKELNCPTVEEVKAHFPSAREVLDDGYYTYVTSGPRAKLQGDPAFRRKSL